MINLPIKWKTYQSKCINITRKCAIFEEIFPREGISWKIPSGIPRKAIEKNFLAAFLEIFKGFYNKKLPRNLALGNLKNSVAIFEKIF